MAQTECFLDLIEVWRDLCIKKFDDVRRDHVKEDFQCPKSWRKYYHVGPVKLFAFVLPLIRAR